MPRPKSTKEATASLNLILEAPRGKPQSDLASDVALDAILGYLSDPVVGATIDNMVK